MQNRVQSRHSTVTRRWALRSIAGFGVGLAAAGCTPLSMVLKIYPKEFDKRARRVDRILRAFCTTVAPGARAADPNQSRVFYDDSYPLAAHRAFFAADLCDRGARVVGERQFEMLSLEDRERVVEHGRAQGGLITRLYAGAVFLTQIAIFAGIYDDETGCSLIEFEGRFRPRHLYETTYPEPERFLPSPVTANGNPA